jgi:hypothetical protein
MVTPMADKKLWEVMDAAQREIPWTYPDHPQRRYAAVLRAIAQEIAKRDPDNVMSALAVEEWLLAEADKAGGGSNV